MKYRQGCRRLRRACGPVRDVVRTGLARLRRRRDESALIVPPGTKWSCPGFTRMPLRMLRTSQDNPRWGKKNSTHRTCSPSIRYLECKKGCPAWTHHPETLACYWHIKSQQRHVNDTLGVYTLAGDDLFERKEVSACCKDRAHWTLTKQGLRQNHFDRNGMPVGLLRMLPG